MTQWLEFRRILLCRRLAVNDQLSFVVRKVVIQKLLVETYGFLNHVQIGEQVGMKRLGRPLDLQRGFGAVAVPKERAARVVIDMAVLDGIQRLQAGSSIMWSVSVKPLPIIM